MAAITKDVGPLWVARREAVTQMCSHAATRHRHVVQRSAGGFLSPPPGGPQAEPHMHRAHVALLRLHPQYTGRQALGKAHRRIVWRLETALTCPDPTNDYHITPHDYQ